MRKRTVNTYPALPQQAHPQVPKPATRHSPPRLVFTHPLAVISPYWLAERPMRRPIAFRPTCSLVFSVLVCSNVCTPLPPGYAWLLRPCPLVCHAILKGDRALPSGVGPADSANGREGMCSMGPAAPIFSSTIIMQCRMCTKSLTGTFGSLFGVNRPQNRTRMIRHKHTLPNHAVPSHASHAIPCLILARRGERPRVCVGKGVASRPSQICIDPTTIRTGPSFSKLSPVSPIL